MFARTERLLLRPGWPEDAPALYDAINDEAIVRNLGRAPWPYAAKDAREFLNRPRPAHIPDFLIFRRTAGAPQLVGSIGVSPDDDGSPEFGYWISRQHWGLGYATEAGRAAMEAASSVGLCSLKAAHYVDNPASGKVLKKLGFRPTGEITRRFAKGRGCKVDAIEYEVRLCADDDQDGMRQLAA
ncbi:Protein N-acetyltransferase, RimJ/RimL family [Parasphingorhabdus marina DSM 22363]|uniref:Protein N-acetyltransferase, RimJ/RimL family n=1 Tax=Parasphingorhabdus marina DSM 22363 TaxID=1123272 RepID=A0A1N6CTR8_9SPHN|nr:GNAT family N-acetyltransferase [Parasphingorhabdus marina]SIN61903.1 Protein N-acetyltransferase, RimJ/RimL family [Parasphingorhabdus marina DSM 22363]